MQNWEEQFLLDSTAADETEVLKVTWWWEKQAQYTATGNVGIAYTYCRKNTDDELECESNPSPVTYINTTAALFIEWTASVDPQVTHVRIYRTLPGDTVLYYSEEFPLSDGYGFFTVSDEALGAEVEDDHDPPPAGASIVAGPDLNGYLFLAKDNLLYWSKTSRPEYWPTQSYIEVSSPSEPITGVTLVSGIVYALTRSDVFQITGTGADSFYPLRQAATTGALSNIGTLGVHGEGILHVANDGLWGYGGGKDDSLTDSRFRPVFRGETAAGMGAANIARMTNAWLLVHRNKIYFAFPDTDDTYPKTMLVVDRASKRVTHHEYPFAMSCATVDRTNDRILVGADDGYLWEIECLSMDTDGDTVIPWEVETMEFSDHVRQYFPRYAKYDVTVSSGATATGYVVLNGDVKQSHPLAGRRDTTKRLVAGSTGKRLQLRIAGEGTVSIWGAEVE
jgi:hypothetical protein